MEDKMTQPRSCMWFEKIESKVLNIVDKKFNDNGYMITIGMNSHF